MRSTVKILLLAAALATNYAAQAQSPFVEVAGSVGLNGLGEAGVPCWFDFDRDGDLDLLRSSRFGGQLQLFINSNGEFREAENVGFPPSTDVQNAQPADFDRDGDIDIFMVGFNTDLMLMVNSNGYYVDRAAELGIEIDSRTRDFEWMDFDGDGFVDMLIEFEDYWKLYRNVRGERFDDVTEYSQLPNTHDNATFAVGDYDLDGDMDVYLARLHGSDYFYRNEGDGQFQNVTAAVGLTASAANCGGIFVDINDDKFPDLVAAGSGHHDIWLNQHGEFFIPAVVHGAEVDFESMGYPYGVRYAAGDVDMDGDFDFMCVSPGGTGFNHGENQFLRCDSVVGTHVWFTNTAPSWNLNSMSDGFPRFADYDDDGDLDLIILQDNSSPLLYENHTNATGRLEVQVLGPDGEEYGWHRRVEIYAHGSDQVLKAGVLSQAAVASSGLNNYFTLDDNVAYDVYVCLATGEMLSPETNAELSNVIPADINHKLVVHMDESSDVTPEPVAPGLFSLHAAYPNPFNPTTTIAFDLPEAARVVYKIYNVVGAEVAVMDLGLKPAGNHSFEWNAGALPSGLYFGRLQAGTLSATQKLVLMK